MVEPADLMMVTAALNNGELARLFRALAARMAGEEVEPFINTSGLRLAFAILSPTVDESMQRLATNRANGARGGRPRKNTEADAVVEGFESVSTKKSKKDIMFAI